MEGRSKHNFWSWQIIKMDSFIRGFGFICWLQLLVTSSLLSTKTQRGTWIMFNTVDALEIFCCLFCFDLEIGFPLYNSLGCPLTHSVVQASPKSRRSICLWVAERDESLGSHRCGGRFFICNVNVWFNSLRRLRRWMNLSWGIEKFITLGGSFSQGNRKNQYWSHHDLNSEIHIIMSVLCN